MTSLDALQPTGPSSLNPLYWRQRWLDMDKNEKVLRWAQSLWGQGILHAAFIGLLLSLPVVRDKHFVLIAFALVLCAVFPARRMLLLTGVGAVYFLLRPLKQEHHYAFYDAVWGSFGTKVPADAGFVGFGLIFIVFAFAMITNQKSRRIGLIARHPVWFMLALATGLSAATIALPQAHPLFAASWISVGYLTGSFFFLGYILLDARAKSALPAYQQLGFLRPVWAAGSVPLKGPAFFRKFEAKNSVELAAARLKAVKLLVWAAILFGIGELLFEHMLFGTLNIPHLETAIPAIAAGAQETLAARWLILGVTFAAELVAFAVAIHVFVAVIRMAGFGIPRGMARPLSSRTMSEFWSRYLFYFKELLADFFFYPTFQRCFKKYPRLRLAFATFMAAFVGNVLFDLISDAPAFAINGFIDTVDNYYSYVIYAAALTAGLIWSQLFQKRTTTRDGWLRHDVVPRVQVILFFALLQVFDNHSGLVDIEDRISFFASLFGVS
ncbi:hypothetical protein [Pseudohoeflea coraliihabitans]|uniref:Uncharacterized protein n=1 Tax=Pseudohoeflea coraliihabitans TaxID=2860393 RepID=A0ABS6WKS0_9HYPH|nr:hypothetical protein [Pseudohoeflea sp. DP4N28-3]MBW3096551.1 hypothetical protein [Pseudohoeflea sp. DP4N28-3]